MDREEIKKYLIRYGVPILIALGLVMLLNPRDVVNIIYKVCVLAIAVMVSDFLWAVSFKRLFGPMEKMTPSKLMPIAVFRGLWNLGIVLAICLGL